MIADWKWNSKYQSTENKKKIKKSKNQGVYKHRNGKKVLISKIKLGLSFMASDIIYQFQKLSLRGTKVINGNQISGRTDVRTVMDLTQSPLCLAKGQWNVHSLLSNIYWPTQFRNIT